MLKKIISLMLVVCMMFTMAISVSAAPEDSAVTAVISEVAQDGTFTVTFYVTPNAEAELQGYAITVNFDETQIAVDSNWKKKSVYGDLDGTKEYNNASIGSVGAVWANTSGMLNEDEENVTADATGNIPVCIFGLKVVEDEANYGNEATLTYSVDTSLLSDGNAKIANVPATGTFVMPDNRPEMTDIAAENKTVDFNGEVVAIPEVTGAPDGAVVTSKILKGTDEITEIVNAGTYTVNYEVKCAGYKTAKFSATVTVNKKAVTVNMEDKSMTYGDLVPELTYTGAPTGVTVTPDVIENPAVGTVDITGVAEDTTGNYTVTVEKGTLTVNKRDVTIAVNAATKNYGEENPAFTAETTNFVGTDAEKVNLSTTADIDSDAGEYDITATLDESIAGNYNVTTNTPNTLTINKIAYAGEAVVAAKNVTTNKEKSYEVDMTSALADIKGAAVVSATENADANDIISNVIVVGNKVTFDVASYATATADIATIDVVVSSTNYENFTATLKISTVDKVELTISGITVADKTYDAAAVVADKSGLTVEGATDPAFDNETLIYAYEGTGETVYSSTEAPVNAGTYKLVISVPETNEDYVGAADVAFTIAKKDVTITVDNAEKYVDAADPEAFTGVTEGFVGTDADAIIYERVAGEEAGTYEITATFDNPNYNVVDNIPGVFTINKYNVEVKAPNVTVYVGKEIPALNATVTITDAIEGLAEEITTAVEVWDGESKVDDISTIDTSEEKTYTTKVVVTCNEGKFDVAAPIDGTLTIKKASGRPSGGGTVIKPATGGSTGGSTTKPEDKEDENKEDEENKASANIAMKENAEEIKFIEGFEDKTFRPDVNATRNDVVAALTALFDITDVENAPEFADTDDKAIKDLAAAGVINGYEDGSFKGYNDVTRAEFVKLLAAALKLEAVEGAEANFSDIEGHWAAEWIKTFASKGYLVGYPDGTFRPEDKITRAEMVVVITRVVGTVDAETAVNFADVDDAHWAYDYIVKAAK